MGSAIARRKTLWWSVTERHDASEEEGGDRTTEEEGTEDEFDRSCSQDPFQLSLGPDQRPNPDPNPSSDPNWNRIKGEQQLLLELFAKRNRGMACVESLRALRDHYCQSDEMSRRTLESFRNMDKDHGGTVDHNELRRAIRELPPKYGRHDVDKVIEWVTQFGSNKKEFNFEQWHRAFQPHMELTESQQVEILKRRKYDLLTTIEHCHNLARSIFAGSPAWVKQNNLNTQGTAIGVALWLFEAKSHQLPKMPAEGEEWTFSTSDYYRDYIDGIRRAVQHHVNI